MVATPREERPARWPGWPVRLIVGAIALGFLAVALIHSLQVTSQISTLSLHAANAAIDQESCLRAEVRRDVPEGALVYIDATGYARQLFIQYLTAWASPVGSASASTVTVSLAPAPSGGCHGEMVKTSAR